MLKELKAKKAIKHLQDILRFSPLPTCTLQPQGEWMDLCLPGSSKIDESVLRNICLSISRQLDMADPIAVAEIYYRTADNPSVMLTSDLPVRIKDGNLFISVISFCDRSKSADTISNVIGSNELLYMILYEVTKAYLLQRGDENISDYLVHVALIYLGFGNYIPTDHGGSYMGYDPSKASIVLMPYGYGDYSDQAYLRHLCKN